MHQVFGLLSWICNKIGHVQVQQVPKKNFLVKYLPKRNLFTATFVMCQPFSRYSREHHFFMQFLFWELTHIILRKIYLTKKCPLVFVTNCTYFPVNQQFSPSVNHSHFLPVSSVSREEWKLLICWFFFLASLGMHAERVSCAYQSITS